jgi:hypothetical protein
MEVSECSNSVETEALFRYVLQVWIMADLVYFCELQILVGIDRDSVVMTHIYIYNKHRSSCCCGN